MRWQSDGPYAIRSDEGYRVSKARVDGVWMYRAWAPGPGAHAIGDVQHDAESARVICQQHADGAR